MPTIKIPIAAKIVLCIAIVFVVAYAAAAFCFLIQLGPSLPPSSQPDREPYQLPPGYGWQSNQYGQLRWTNTDSDISCLVSPNKRDLVDSAWRIYNLTRTEHSTWSPTD
jgi:hypothetical protein